MPTQPSRSVTLSFCLSSRQYGYSNTYSCLKSSISKYFPRCTWLRIIYFTEVITKPKVSAIVIKYKIWLPFCFFPLATDINIGVIWVESQREIHTLQEDVMDSHYCRALFAVNCKTVVGASLR